MVGCLCFERNTLLRTARKPKGLIMDRLGKLSETLRSLIAGAFTGYIKINFTQGNMGRIEKFEEFNEVIAHDRNRDHGAERKDRK